MDEFPIHRAAEEGDLERVKKLTEEGMSPLDSRDNLGRTSLHCAAEAGRYAVVDFLSGLPECDLNLKDGEGCTPVLLAAKYSKRYCNVFARFFNRTVVDLLLRRGAQVDCADDSKWTLLLVASRQGWTTLVQCILDRREGDLNGATMRGDTPLMWAAYEGHESVAALLIRAGADVNRRNGKMVTALHMAAYCDRTKVVQRLLEVEGLDLNPQHEEGDTPLHYVCREGQQEVLKQLLVAGADSTIRNNDGETALSIGIRQGNLTLEEIRLFVQCGAFLQESEYVHISLNPVLKESVLKDVGLCTQSIVNKFHRQSLPALGSVCYLARRLPNIDKFKLTARQIDEVENLVECEIERNTFCNVVRAHPMALSALCVLSLITC